MLIAGAAATEFEAQLRALSPADAAKTLADIVTDLDLAAISESERERRLRLVWNRADADHRDFVAISTVAAEIKSSVLRNAVTALLPASLRRAVYAPNGALPSPPAVTAASHSAEDSAIVAHVAPPREAPFRDVLLLSTEDDLATRKLLHEAGFTYHRVTGVDEAREMLRLNTQICGFVLNASFLGAVVDAEQRALIEMLAGYSTFAVLKVDDSALAISNSEALSIVRETQCALRQPDAARIILAATSGVQERHLPQFNSASARLSVGATAGLFLPGEVSENELRLIASSLHAYAASRNFRGSIELDAIHTRFLRGGLSTAKVAIARVNDARTPVILKVNEKQAVIEEARRFYRYILPLNDDLVPEVYFHSDAALIVFGVIAHDEMHPESGPAPTLSEVLKGVWFNEMRGLFDDSAQAMILAGFHQAVRRLAALNRERPQYSDSILANPYLQSIKRVEGTAFSWGFHGEAMTARTEGERLIEIERGSAICHGDSHIGNILLRRDQGFLIDYSYSGPGHPAVDLARLELSIFLRCVHPFGTLEQWADFQHHVSRADIDEAHLLERYALLFPSKTNRLALKMMLIARDTCFAILYERRISDSHYRAAKLLLAWQCLVSPDFEQGLVRCVIAALSRHASKT